MCHKAAFGNPDHQELPADGFATYPGSSRVIRTAMDDGHKKSPCFQGLQFFWDLLEYSNGG